MLAALVFGVTLLAVQRTRLTAFERDLFRLINDLPAWMGPVLVVAMQAGNVVAAPVTALLALIRRSRRLSFDLAVSGTVAWIAAKAIKDWIARPRPGGFLDDITRLAEDAGRGYVSGHTAVAVALAAAASPYLPRRWRRAVWAVAWVVGLARVYEGVHLPLDIVGGAAVGWFIAAIVHVTLGAPHQRPSLSEAQAALGATGLAARSVSPVPGEPQGSFPFVAEAGEGRVFVKLLDPETRDRDLLYRLFRILSFRDRRDEVALRDAVAQADHEAAMTLLAREAGVRAPAIKRIQAMHGRVWVAEQWVDGPSLERAGGGAISDDVLVDAWRQVERLHAGHLAHRDLVADNMLLGGDGRVWLVDFAHAMSSPPPAAYDNDIAEMITSLALIVGEERAIAAAREVLPEERLRASAGELQVLALTQANRHRLREQPGLLARLRMAISPEHPHLSASDGWSRFNRSAIPVSIALGSMLLIAVVGRPAAVADALTGGSMRWLAVTAMTSAAAVIATAIALIAASGRPLAVGRSAVAVVVARAASIVGGPSARRVAIERYLELSGLGSSRTPDIAERVRLAGYRPRGSPRVVLSVAAAAVTAIAVECAALMAALETVGANEPLAAVAGVFVVAVAIDRWLDAPAGVREVVTLAGLLIAGLSLPLAAAGVLIFFAVTVWLPAAAGAVAALLLRDHTGS